jgi:tRNA-dihydrouridine synthase B
MSFNPITIGPYELSGQALLAPMSGVSDAPFRDLCLTFGASATYSEMITSDISLWHREKTQKRLAIQNQSTPRCIQLLGAEPAQMAIAAKLCVDLGADIIDINMGCPAKKVCHQSAGSALLKDPQRVANILSAVVSAVDVPVTLKYRTGWIPSEKNAVQIACMAQDIGIQALTLHGRTGSEKFNGQAEQHTVAKVVAAVKIPVIANGDICTGKQAKKILDQTGANGIMIGRAAQGKPWIFREVNEYLNSGSVQTTVTLAEIYLTMLQHLHAIHQFYGEEMGIRIARKHLGWYFDYLPKGHEAKHQINRCTTTFDQIDCIHAYFEMQLRCSTTSKRQLELITIANGEVLAA